VGYTSAVPMPNNTAPASHIQKPAPTTNNPMPLVPSSTSAALLAKKRAKEKKE